MVQVHLDPSTIPEPDRSEIERRVALAADGDLVSTTVVLFHRFELDVLAAMPYVRVMATNLIPRGHMYVLELAEVRTRVLNRFLFEQAT